MGTDFFLGPLGMEQRRDGVKLKDSWFRLDIRKSYIQWGWNTGVGYPEMFELLHPWKHWRSGCTTLWTTWSGCLIAGDWTRWLLKVSFIPNHSMTLWSAFVLKVNKGMQHKRAIRILPTFSVAWNAERSRRLTWIWRP